MGLGSVMRWGKDKAHARQFNISEFWIDWRKVYISMSLSLCLLFEVVGTRDTLIIFFFEVVVVWSLWCFADLTSLTRPFPAADALDFTAADFTLACLPLLDGAPSRTFDTLNFRYFSGFVWFFLRVRRQLRRCRMLSASTCEPARSAFLFNTPGQRRPSIWGSR